MEVKAVVNHGDWEVAVFENNKRANLIIYNVSEQIATDAMSQGVDCVDSLMDTAEHDFITWSDYQKSKKTDPAMPIRDTAGSCRFVQVRALITYAACFRKLNSIPVVFNPSD